MNEFFFGIFLIVLSSVTTSSSTVFKSQAVKILGPFTILSIGSFVGAAFLFVTMLVLKQKFKLSEIKKDYRDFIVLVISRALVGEALFIFGLSLTVAVKAIFLTKIEPYFILIWAWFIKREKPKPSHLALLIFHLAGAFTLSTGLSFGEVGGAQLGDLLIVTAMIAFSLSYHSGTKFAKKVGAIQTNMLMNFVSGILFLPLAIFISPHFFSPNILGVKYMMLSALLYDAIGLTLWFAALKYVKAWMASALRVVGPLVAAPVAYVLFGQALSHTQILGGFVVLLTSFLIAREHRKTLVEEPAE